ncbi:MAG: hypothetical protein R3F45_07295 [Gammaproteobacteria bacterium]
MPQAPARPLTILKSSSCPLVAENANRIACRGYSAGPGQLLVGRTADQKVFRSPLARDLTVLALASRRDESDPAVDRARPHTGDPAKDVGTLTRMHAVSEV